MTYDALVRFIAEQRVAIFHMPAHDGLVVEGVLLELEARLIGVDRSDSVLPLHRMGRVVVDVHSEAETVQLDVRTGINPIEVLDRARDALSEEIGRR
jgi:hypothetical protein